MLVIDFKILMICVITCFFFIGCNEKKQAVQQEQIVEKSEKIKEEKPRIYDYSLYANEMLDSMEKIEEELVISQEKYFGIPKKCISVYSKDSVASHNCCLKSNGCWAIINNDTILVPYANPKNMMYIKDIRDIPVFKRID
ncbi:MAG: hypothetical protein FWH22_03635 [Fibromonadales bacterium]|nr:hypothetical protein [Fibromonadales bacterium]